ncbi:hypothetical protein CO2235_U660005 [Cupriavidus oxalaticus]|uniref:Uncharacterized protein n=1 Tax=Cupriavidus oxalaticus TaxID=96344 RepID=A0A375FNV4_9BURK|nr:hypothetical protein CO2235_U660005 [Cupriavidus oxalaticus]
MHACTGIDEALRHACQDSLTPARESAPAGGCPRLRWHPSHRQRPAGIREGSQDRRHQPCRPSARGCMPPCPPSCWPHSRPLRMRPMRPPPSRIRRGR